MSDKQENRKKSTTTNSQDEFKKDKDKPMFSENLEGKDEASRLDIAASVQNTENSFDFSENTDKDELKKDSEISKFDNHLQKELISKESNYQVSLINENLLRIVVVTDKSIGVDCTVKDKKLDKETSSQTQSNKILINPKDDGSKQEVEIIVAINPVKDTSLIEGKKATEEFTSENKKKLLIDPSVSDLVEEQKKRDKLFEQQYIPKTREEYYQERLKPNNPYRKNLKLIEKHLKVGTVISVIVFLITIIIYSSIAASKEEVDNDSHQRLIVIQDVPETINEVPVKKEESLIEDENKDDIPSNIISKPRPTKIKTPKIVSTEIKKDTTQKDTSDITMINKTLDKERKTDTTRADSNFVRNYIDTTNAKIIYMDYQKYGWQKTDEVTGLTMSNDTSQFLTDRSNNRKYGDFDLKIVKDINGVLFTCKGDAKQFPMKDTSYTAVSCGPLKEEKLSKKYNYYFQVKNKTNTYAVTIIATINEIYLDEYKTKVDDVVSGMKIPTE